MQEKGRQDERWYREGTEMSAPFIQSNWAGIVHYSVYLANYTL